jgi:ribosomal protein S18 acetylase RimI-like enzyme
LALAAPPIGPNALERIAARAWPAAQHRALGGWDLYASDGYSLRINACWPVGDPGPATEAAIEAVEAFYAGLGLATIFKLTEGATVPGDLADHLRRRGYGPGKETLVMTGLVGDGANDGSVTVSNQLDPDFSAVMAATAPSPKDGAERLAALDRVAQPRLFAKLVRDDQAAAIGACAVEGTWAGIFGMRTHPDHRRQGLASQILQALLAKAADHGAKAAYLQVEAKNTGAIALYEAAGFKTVYRYFYWEKQAA